MKACKNYTCKISGNKCKINYLLQQLEIIEDLSWYIFNLKQQFGINWWFDHKKLYHQCRRMFPELNSKIIQIFMRYNYKVVKGKKLPKTPCTPMIILDYQNFKFLENSKTKITNFWLKFHRKCFPLLGKKILSKINQSCQIKEARIYMKNNELYCMLATSYELSMSTPNRITVGCDVNYKRVVTSDNIFYDIRQLAHRKMEHKKNNQHKRNLTNYSKDFLHKLTTQISDDLQSKGIDVLVLEDLKNLNKSASRKNGTSKGKLINYIINSFPYKMFQSFLEYKCLDRGIQVIKVNPAYTSQTCSRCTSRNSDRPRQQDFVCKDCNLHLDADLNGARNIRLRYTHPDGPQVNLVQSRP